jgi:microcystin-dependent protein
MPGQTANRGYPYPLGSDPIDAAGDIQRLAESLDADVSVASSSIGELREYASMDALPPGFLVCDGRNVSRVTYAALFTKIGTTWGAGDGSTTFGIPNLINRFTRGVASAAGAGIGGTGGSADAVPVAHAHAATGGAGAHSHNMNVGVGVLAYAHPNGTAVINSGPTWGVSQPWVNAPDHTHTVPTAGVSGTNANLPPYGTVVKAIFTGVI